MKTILTLIFVGFVFSATAQIDTNKPARFKTKIVSHSPGSEGTSISPSPEAIFPGSETADTVTSPGQESELKWKFIGRKGDKDLYHFTFTRMTKAGVPGKTTDTKDVLFDGHQAKLFQDDLHTVTIDSPSEKDLKNIAPRKQI